MCVCVCVVLSCHTIYSVRPFNRLFAVINLAGNSNCQLYKYLHDILSYGH